MNNSENKSSAKATQNLTQWFHQEAVETATGMAGGLARLKVIIIMACVLGLDSADKATVGAVAVQLKHALHIGNLEIGMLVTASTGIGALATLPMGILSDRIQRTHILTVSIVFWSITMVINGFANSYLMLLLTRLALGAVIAAAYPAITSLTGDYFRPGVRGRIWGYVLSGELFGAGFGILISGEMAALLSWRYAFWVLAFMSMVLAIAVWLWLPEPSRGVQSHLQKEKEKIPSTEELRKKDDEQQVNKKEQENDKVKKKINNEEISPRQDQILTCNPAEMSFWKAVKYILSIRTNVLLIIASACGYFFFTGLRTFAVVFMRGRFDLNPGMGNIVVVGLGLGAIAGVFISGYLSDRELERGHLHARITLGAMAFLITSILFLAAFYIRSFFIAAPIFFLAAIGFGGTNAPLDAARLDIMHSRLWGRAESVRTTLRYIFEALAPLVFGWVSTLFGGHGAFSESTKKIASKSIMPLTYTFRLMLIPVIIAAVILFFARKYYPRDVATVLASENREKDKNAN